MLMRLGLTLVIALLSGAAQAQGGYCGGADLDGNGGIGGSDFVNFGACFSDPLSNPPTEGILGVTESAVVPVDAGWMGMNGACVATFGAGA